MIAVVDRLVQYPNRYKLTNAETGEVLGTFDFEEATGTVQQVGTEINKALFDSIATDLAARVKLSGGELSRTIVTFSDISGTAANVASGDTSATLWGKVKNWFSRLKALAFKDTIRNADVASNAAIAQSKISGLENALASKANNADLAAIAKSGDLADATQDATHRVVTDTEKSTWNAKQNAITGAASTIASQNLTANRALVSNGSGKVGVSAVTSTELGYLDGVTSNIQSQFNGIEDGNTVVGKAIADKNGNDIFDTYATKEGLTASSRGLFRTSQDLTDKPIGATVQVLVIAGEDGAIPKVDDYVYDEWGNFARLVSVASNVKWNVVPFAKAINSYTTSNPPPYPVKSVAGKTGAVTLAKGDVGLSNVDNVKQYSASNPPPYPVRSVNGKTGAVALSAADVGAATITQVNETSMVPDSGNATNLTVPASGGRVEIEADGWLCVRISKTTANGQYITMIVQKEDGTDKWGCVNTSTTYFQNNYPIEFLPVKKGDYVRTSYNIAPSRIQLIRAKQV